MNTQDLKAGKQFSIFFFLVALFVFVIVSLRSIYVPFNHDETATFFFFIQSGHYMPFHSAADANNHILNSLLGNLCFHLFGSSPLSLRLPNLLGLIVLIFATYRISLKLKQLGSKLFLTAGLLISFNWLSFFSACRGYGLSMAMLLAGIAFMLEYVHNPERKNKFIVSLVFFQLAISANLILIIVVLLLSGIIALIQLFNKKLFQPLTLIIWLVHLGTIYYWLSFSFFLQDNGALYYGAGDSYWKVTFVSLVHLIFGFETSVLKYGLVILFLLVLFLVIYYSRNSIFKVKEQFKKPAFSLLFAFILGCLCVGFYAMHKLLGVNYPEDRTGLFFYLFFVLLISFTFDLLSPNLNTVILGIFSFALTSHFMLNLNFRKHSLNVYETIPEHFYTTLLKEQSITQERITIGGHRVRELFYAFLNYRHGGALYSADPVEVMQMNCDYYIATKQEEKYFKPYYNIIDTEPDWGFVLLKRKEKIVRNKVLELNSITITNDENEFIGLYGHNDTIFSQTAPLLAEIDLDIEKIPIPVNTWFVLQINDSLDQTVYFKRYPLQWSCYDLNGRKHLLLSVLTGNLPSKSKKIACFFWNIEKQSLGLKVNSLKISQLDGKGVDYEAPDIK
ncbi:MAG: hypothetical protein H7141_07525 [Burkholderiales bacterium]|nr:hypothetical protein [Bacteroidia bacterium]